MSAQVVPFPLQARPIVSVYVADFSKSAALIDLPQTAQNRRAAAATGCSPKQPPVLIKVGKGDYVIDGDSSHAGTITHFNHRDGHTRAVVQGHGCMFSASLIDLAPCAQPRLFGDH